MDVKDGPLTQAQAVGKTRRCLMKSFRMSKVTWELNFLRAQFRSWNFFKLPLQNLITMNGMNDKTPESHECKGQLRLQKRREQRRTNLVCEKLSNAR